jgi:hypothetical protein
LVGGGGGGGGGGGSSEHLYIRSRSPIPPPPTLPPLSRAVSARPPLERRMGASGPTYMKSLRARVTCSRCLFSTKHGLLPSHNHFVFYRRRILLFSVSKGRLLTLYYTNSCFTFDGSSTIPCSRFSFTHCVAKLITRLPVAW